MKYTEFVAKAEALGFIATFGDYGSFIKVLNKRGARIGTVYGILDYDFDLPLQDQDLSLWGSNAKRRLINQYIMQLASTEIKNRGKMPIKEAA